MAENAECLIKYTHEGKEYTTHIYPSKGWEDTFAVKILNRIESLVDAGVKITYIERHGI